MLVGDTHSPGYVWALRQSQERFAHLRLHVVPDEYMLFKTPVYSMATPAVLAFLKFWHLEGTAKH